MKRKEGSFLEAGTIARFVFAAIVLIFYYVIFNYIKLNPDIAGKMTSVTRATGMIMSGAASYVKYTVAEILLYLVLTLIAAYIVITVYQIIAKKHIGARLLRFLSNILALGSIFIVIYFPMFGINYLAPADIIPQDSVVQEIDTRNLEVLTKYLQNKANEYASSMPRDENGNCEFGDLSTKSSLVIDAYENLAYKYSFISGTFAPVKTLSNSKSMKKAGLAGKYIPFTGESVIDNSQPEPCKMFNIAKVFANRLSIARDEDANFAAFLVCRDSSDRRVAYSAYFMAYQYCINALSNIDMQKAAAIKAELNESMSLDIIQYKEYIQKSGGFLEKINSGVHNAYLKHMDCNDEEESRTLFVEYLLTEYKGLL